MKGGQPPRVQMGGSLVNGATINANGAKMSPSHHSRTEYNVEKREIPLTLVSRWLGSAVLTATVPSDCRAPWNAERTAGAEISTPDWTSSSSMWARGRERVEDTAKTTIDHSNGNAVQQRDALQNERQTITSTHFIKMRI